MTQGQVVAFDRVAQAYILRVGPGIYANAPVLSLRENFVLEQFDEVTCKLVRRPYGLLATEVRQVKK